jgi:hypothetical protein
MAGLRILMDDVSVLSKKKENFNRRRPKEVPLG